MNAVGQITMIVYGLLLLGGGIMAYVTKGSQASLFSGGASGILELVAYFLARTQPRAGLGLGAGVALVLTVMFLYLLLKTGKMMPDGMLLALSVAALILIGAALLRRNA